MIKLTIEWVKFYWNKLWRIWLFNHSRWWSIRFYSY